MNIEMFIGNKCSPFLVNTRIKKMRYEKVGKYDSYMNYKEKSESIITDFFL